MSNGDYQTVETLRRWLMEQPPEFNDYVILVDLDWKLTPMTKLVPDAREHTWGAGRHTRTFPGAFITEW